MVCWLLTEDLVGLRHQAVGLAQALGLAYEIKSLERPKNIWQKIWVSRDGLGPPWPDVLISCGQRSVPVARYIAHASGSKTFTVHIQNPHVNPKRFDVVVAPAHDRLCGENVFLTQGAIHHVTREKLEKAACDFRHLLAALPTPIVSVLLGGNNRHQQFSPYAARDLGDKLTAALQGKGLAITPSRRTSRESVDILKQHIKQTSHYIWEGEGENPYFGLLALADVLVVTSDSVSMISEACFTGKQVYVYELPGAGRRHREFLEKLKKDSFVRSFLGKIESWKSMPLDETQKAADFVRQIMQKKEILCQPV